jgi:hypothetical protein
MQDNIQEYQQTITRNLQMWVNELVERGLLEPEYLQAVSQAQVMADSGQWDAKGFCEFLNGISAMVYDLVETNLAGEEGFVYDETPTDIPEEASQSNPSAQESQETEESNEALV